METHHYQSLNKFKHSLWMALLYLNRFTKNEILQKTEFNQLIQHIDTHDNGDSRDDVNALDHGTKIQAYLTKEGGDFSLEKPLYRELICAALCSLTGNAAKETLPDFNTKYSVYITEAVTCFVQNPRSPLYYKDEKSLLLDMILKEIEEELKPYHDIPKSLTPSHAPYITSDITFQKRLLQKGELGKDHKIAEYFTIQQNAVPKECIFTHQILPMLIALCQQAESFVWQKTYYPTLKKIMERMNPEHMERGEKATGKEILLCARNLSSLAKNCTLPPGCQVLANIWDEDCQQSKHVKPKWDQLPIERRITYETAHQRMVLSAETAPFFEKISVSSVPL